MSFGLGLSLMVQVRDFRVYRVWGFSDGVGFQVRGPGCSTQGSFQWRHVTYERYIVTMGRQAQIILVQGPVATFWGCGF